MFLPSRLECEHASNGSADDFEELIDSFRHRLESYHSLISSSFDSSMTACLIADYAPLPSEGISFELHTN